MGYFDGYTANLFRLDGQQRRVITPWGTRGAVYLVATEAQAERIVRAVRRAYQVMLPVVIGSVLLLGWRWMIALGLLWLVGFYLTLYSVTRGLPRSEDRVRDLPKVSRSEMQGRMANALGRRWLIALLVVAVLFLAVGLWSLVTTGPAVSTYYLIGYSVLCCAIFAYQLRRIPRA